MSKREKVTQSVLLIAALMLILATSSFAEGYKLQRTVMPKPVYNEFPSNLDTDNIVIKLKEGMGQPEFDGKKFLRSGSEWDQLNNLIFSTDKSSLVSPRISTDKAILDEMRLEGIRRSGIQLADLTLYHNLKLSSQLNNRERLEIINEINSLDIVEVAFFPPYPEIATLDSKDVDKSPPKTPSWESGQYYLQAAPTGVNAYYAWGYTGGKGDDIKVIDIEGNWIETHEDLHGGTDNFHIAGSLIDDPGWYNHGTAVLGEIAADSNSFGMTGIAYNVDLGTVSIGSMSTSSAITTAINNSDTGDVILIELHAPGPNASGSGQEGYVAMEYWQDNFDAILNGSALGRIICEAAGNGNEDYDDFLIYGSLFDPDVRFSGAIMIGASSSSHVPASFTNYGERVDVHAFGTWDVYTLGYGGLYGSTPSDYYTASFSGTSSASPIITGAVAILEGVNKANHGRVLDHAEIRELLTAYSTPQASHYKKIGPLPDLQGSVNQIVGISFIADTTFGWTPLDVNFSASSGLAVDTWKWEFGDGDSAFVQSPSHTYNDAGMYTVGIEIDAAGDIRSISKVNYIVALADTIQADSIITTPGESVVITLSANNTVPVNKFQIPVEYGGDLTLNFDSMSTVDCRTDYFEIQEFAHYDPYFDRITVRLNSSTSGTSPKLPPGEGDILKLHFTVSSSATIGQTSSIITDGYNTYTSYIESSLGTYDLESLDGEVFIGGCCVGIRGNIDGDINDEINISDIVYIVSYSFDVPSGPAPPCFEEADVNATGTLDIADIVYMVDYSFGSPSGPPPVNCY